LLVLIAITLSIIAAARPQAVEPEEVVVEGIDIYLALDMSGSMRAIDLERNEIRQLARLGKRPLNRFEYAVATLRDFIRGRKWDRIGMVIFAKDAFLQFPLTLDRVTILDMLGRLRLGDIDEGGTAIGNAIGRGVAGLKDSDAATKILILITDGDRRGGNISPKQATRIAKELGVHIYPILVGKKGTTLVPAGRQIFSGRVSYQERRFPVNPDLLKEIAKDTGGSYYRATDQKGLEEDLHRILDRYERTRMRDATNVDPRELYRPLAAWAIALLAVGFVLRFTVLRKFP
jgi:Ca-activated chloride channel family protein